MVFSMRVYGGVRAALLLVGARDPSRGQGLRDPGGQSGPRLRQQVSAPSFLTLVTN